MTKPLTPLSIDSPRSGRHLILCPPPRSHLLLMLPKAFAPILSASGLPGQLLAQMGRIALDLLWAWFLGGFLKDFSYQILEGSL